MNTTSHAAATALRDKLTTANRDDQQKLREIYDQRAQKPLLAIAEARANAAAPDFTTQPPPRPAFLGRRIVDDITVADLDPFIDWTFFFSAWDLKGKYPKILDDPRLGEAARDLFENGRELLDEIIEKRWLEPRGVYGFWPSRRDGDDIVLYDDEDLASEISRFPMLRQQSVQGTAPPDVQVSGQRHRSAGSRGSVRG